MKEKIINRLLEITGGLSVIALFFGIYTSLEFLGILWILASLYWILVVITSPAWIKVIYKIFYETHQFNLEQRNEDSDQEVYFFDATKLYYYPKKIVHLLKRS